MIVPFENFNSTKARVNLLHAGPAVNIAHCRYTKPSFDEFFMPDAAVTYVRQGRKVVFLNGEQHNMKAGDALFVPRNSILYSDILVKKEDFISINMILHATAADQQMAALACLVTGNAPVRQLAADLHMSLSTFQRWFGKKTGCSPRQWMIEKRLEHARYLLLGRGAAVAEACYGSGFEDVSYFIRRYRQRFGATPARDAKN